MSLHGLLDAVVKDPALAEAISAAADGNRMHVDLVGPRRPAPSPSPRWPATRAAPCSP